MVAMLLAYDAAGAIIGTLDYMVARNDAGEVVGLIDFEAHEAQGGRLRDIWDVPGATGSATWPEFLGGAAHDFTVELASGRITALVHRASGHRRERVAIEAAIEAAPMLGEARDLRAIVGGPGRPLALDSDGRTIPRARLAGTPAHLPRIGQGPP